MTDNTSKHTYFIIIMMLLTAVVVFNPAYAASSTLGNVDNVLQSIVDMMTGTTARLMAIICVAAVGIGWMYGFIDLRKAAYCLLGIGIVFGAPNLVGTLMVKTTPA
ncbi:TrbC/VirB2 family protein [Bartonella sp. F02]|uniref:TrbC/VirB2 family protein n=1 Tax=Bartonella sp. F02 TaxID=2967262 RepID=UPI0022A90CC6|nr:TrbC/VirB2 family protein [Bartonella sp. F02]MCZ2328933.1 TrbC/VirB2 family protein [Bartonella sp. F02]